MHNPDCRYCKLKPHEGEFLFGVKNAETREYRHILAHDSEEAKDKAGWNGSTLYVMIVRIPSAPMAEETKARLRQIQAERKAVCGPRKRERK